MKKAEIRKFIKFYQKQFRNAPSYKEGQRFKVQIQNFERMLKEPAKRKARARMLSGGLPGLGKR
jgi:hypothetical protein